MRDYKWIFIITIFCILCVSSVSCICVFNCCGSNLPAKAKRQISFQQEMGQGLTLMVTTKHGHIRVHGTDESQCSVEAYVTLRANNNEIAKRLADQVQIRLERSGDTVTLAADELQSEEDFRVYISYDIKVPRKTSLILETSHDSIECKALEGNVTASTSHDSIICSDISGDLELSTSHDNIECARIIGDLELQTSHDDIELSDITGTVKARTTHDSIHAGRINGPVRLSSTHGDIRCKELNSEKLYIHTSHNDVEVSFSDNVLPGLDADITTSHGDIICDLPLEFAGDVNLVAKSGKVKTDIPIKVKGEISTSRITGQIGQGTGWVNLKTKHGTIKLK